MCVLTWKPQNYVTERCMHNITTLNKKAFSLNNAGLEHNQRYLKQPIYKSDQNLLWSKKGMHVTPSRLNTLINH